MQEWHKGDSQAWCSRFVVDGDEDGVRRVGAGEGIYYILPLRCYLRSIGPGGKRLRQRGAVIGQEESASQMGDARIDAVTWAGRRDSPDPPRPLSSALAFVDHSPRWALTNFSQFSADVAARPEERGGRAGGATH